MRRQMGHVVEWPFGSGRYAVNAVIEDGPDMGREVWFSLTRAGGWYVDDGHLGYDDARSVRRFADGCGLSLRHARRLLGTVTRQEVAG